MTVLVALGIAILALALSSAGVLALTAWQRNRQYFDALADRLSVDARMEQMTVQTLAAMREAARRGGWS